MLFIHKRYRKIRAKLTYFLAPLILILLTGCPADGVCITPINTQASNLTLHLSGGTKCKGSASDIVEVYFLLNDKTKRFFPTIWTIKSKSQEGKRLDKVVYGTVPEGFTQTAPALPIHPEDIISVSARTDYTVAMDIEIKLTK